MERFTHHKIRSAAVGVSINPFKNSSDEKMCRDFLDHIGLAIFRDDYSYQLAKKLTQNKNLFSEIAQLIHTASPSSKSRFYKIKKVNQKSNTFKLLPIQH